ncbi:transcription termination/antitermination protein NusA [bacterium]|jgi:transcription elongation protein nusA|nr:transcription termination/antitermination protein NusA [bacterium]
MSKQQSSGSELIKALNVLVEEKNISPDVVFEALQLALQTAYKKNFNSKTNVRVDINRETGDIKVYSYYVVVPEIKEAELVEDEEGNITRIEPEINRDAQILLEDAQKKVPNIKVGETIEEEVTPKDFGRVAAGTAKQVVMQKIREAEKNSVIEEFSDKQDELMIGMVAMEDQNNYYIDLGRTRGILPKRETIPGEQIIMGSNIKVYVSKVESGPKGPIIKLSRNNYGFVKRLFEHEIPEVANGTIVIAGVAREPGIRTKIALYSINDRIDAIGSCIGERGSRIAGILKELKGEKVDLVLYSEDAAEYIKNAMTPAKDVIVSIPDAEVRNALVIVGSDNLSAAIGKKGSNIKLASKLTKYHLEIKTMEEIQQAGNK